MILDFFENKYFFAMFAILIFSYASQIRQPLPKFMMDLFQNPIFRICILFLVLVRSKADLQFSLIVAVSYVLIMNNVSDQLFKESFIDSRINEYFSESDNSNKKTKCTDTYQKIYNMENCIHTCNNTKSDDVCDKLKIEKNSLYNVVNTQCDNVKIDIENKPSDNLNCNNYYK